MLREAKHFVEKTVRCDQPELGIKYGESGIEFFDARNQQAQIKRFCRGR